MAWVREGHTEYGLEVSAELCTWTSKNTTNSKTEETNDEGRHSGSS